MLLVDKITNLFIKDDTYFRLLVRFYKLSGLFLFPGMMKR